MSNNPLKNYFRKPALTIKLPSGGQGYKEGALQLPESGELSIYPMTAMDEINVKTPENLTNGNAVVGLVRSCIPDIKDPWEILSTDLDTLLLGIRIATTGKMLKVETECPNCSAENKHDINVYDMLAAIGNSGYDQLLSLNGLSIKFKPLNYRQIMKANESQTQIQRKIDSIDEQTSEEAKLKISAEVIKELNNMSFVLVGEAVEYIKTPDNVVFEKEFIREFLENCDKDTFDKIKQTNLDLRAATDIKPVNLTCTSCNHEYEFSLDINVNSI
jgi:hypothetical protein